MKLKSLLIFFGCIGCFTAVNLFAQTADEWVALGRTALTNHDLVTANTDFNNAVTVSPTNQEANALLAATRLLLLPNQPAGSNFLNSLKFSTAGRNIYNWTSTLPKDISGNTVLPTNNTSVAIAFFRTNVMTAIGASRTNLSRITDPTFTLSLTADETSLESVTMDYGDILLVQSLLRMAEFTGYTLNAHNFNIVISHLHDLGKTNGLTIQRVLSDYPSLLTLTSTNDLAASKGALTNAIASYFAASDFIRNTRPSGALRLFNLDPDDETNETVFRDYLTNFLLSLSAPVKFNTNDQFSLYAGSYFSGAKSLRSLLPKFNGNNYVWNSLPDYTFGGFLVDNPACDTEAFLRNHFYHSYAGCYVGQIGGFPNDGNLAVFVGTNQQVSVVGYNDDQGNGIFLQFAIQSDGSWYFETNDIPSSSGNFYTDGSFDGYLNWINDGWAEIWGNRQDDLGPFQSAAGFYSGTWSTNGAQGGKFQAVLSADGHIYYFKTGYSAEVDDGGDDWFDSNNQFSSTSVVDTGIGGTLNRSTLAISGNFTNLDGLTGTFTTKRTAFVPSDVPPTITLPPQNKTVSVGSNVTFSVTASGSPPLCYQWYFNDVAIYRATNSSLLMSNVSLAANGNRYSVLIRNVVGGTNATAILTVVDTNRPTLSITNLVAGQRVSNALFTVKGTASDNWQVSNVVCQINGGGWNPTTNINNWTNWAAGVTLSPGTNMVQAFAMDTSGNVSTTNGVSFQFVVPNQLTLQLTGKGMFNPNYSNAWLEIGRNYSITSAPASGFVFTSWLIATNWIGGTITTKTNLQFMMATNLTLQANFLDVTKPTLTITSPTAGQKMTNALANVKGTASDNWGVSNVWYQLNSNAWSLATSTNGWTNWSVTLTLAAGTNTVKAYATDWGGNLSTNYSVHFVSSNTFKLQLGFTTGQPMTTNGLDFNVQISLGLNGRIQASTNLVDWMPLTNFVGTNATLYFRDAAATNYEQRFYRAVVP